MERREFLQRSVKVTAVGALTGGVAGCTTRSAGPAVQTSPRVRWRIASSFPRSLDTIFGAAEQLSNRVSAITSGRFSIHVHQAGEIVGPLQVLDTVQQGTVEMGHTASYYFRGKEETLAFDTAVPFGLTARQHGAWLLHGGGMDLMRDIFADFGIVNLPGGNTGVQMGGWFRDPIGSLADLEGLKMRIPGMGGLVMDRLGVSVQNIAGGDIYPSLERGAIDATEWVGPYDDHKLGFYKIAKNYHYPGWWEPGPALSFYVNKTAWDQLPSTYQAVLETAAADASLDMMTEYDAKNPPALQQLLDSGVRMIPFPDDVMVAARSATKELMAELCGANARFRKVHDHWRKFQIASSRWFATAEQSFTNFMFKG